MNCLENFIGNVKLCIADAVSRTSDFNSRSSRAEYRYVYGVYFLVITLITILISYYAFHGVDFTNMDSVIAAKESINLPVILLQLLSLGCYIVILPLMIRRFQDTDRSAIICKVLFAHTAVSALLSVSSLLSVTTLHQYWLMLNSVGIVSFVIWFATLYMHVILFFVKGSEGRNEYGMPSCALTK